MIYLVYGDEKYELYRFIESIKKKQENLELGINYFNITNENINEIDSIYETVTFFSSSKLVIIKDTKLKFDIQKLLDKSDSEDTYVIIEDSLDKRTSEYKLLSKNSEVKEFKHLNEKELSIYIINVIKQYGLNISADTAYYMINNCSTDKYSIINEMQKLVILLDKGTNITKSHIDEICSRTLTTKIFDMLDYAIRKDKKNAIKLLDELLITKEPIVKISIMLYKQIKNMYLIKYMQNCNINNINEILKLNPYIFTKLSKSCNNYKLNKLKDIIYRFGEYDYKTKSGLMDFEIGLKQIICML